MTNLIFTLVGLRLIDSLGRRTLLLVGSVGFWVFISEILPNRYRVEGQSFGCSIHWIAAAILTFVFPWLIETISIWIVFRIFCATMVLQLRWAILLMPETKGASLESLELRLMH